jgi:hypothetical protein
MRRVTIPLHHKEVFLFCNLDELVKSQKLGDSLVDLPACTPCPSSARELALVSARGRSQAFYEVVNLKSLSNTLSKA